MQYYSTAFPYNELKQKVPMMNLNMNCMPARKSDDAMKCDERRSDNSY